MSNILEQLSQLVQQAVTQAVKAGTLPEINPDDLKIEISKPNKNFGGDYSCGVALTLTRALKRPPMQIGEAIEAAFPEAPDVVEKIWLTPPGFINFKLAHRWLTNNLKLIRDQGSGYADQDFGNQERVMIEFVSVNPTGPLHVGHARGAILGSALANILTKTGHAVWCEYYVNDAGTQNRIFQEAMYNLIHPKQSLAQYKAPPAKNETKTHPFLNSKKFSNMEQDSGGFIVDQFPDPSPSLEKLNRLVGEIPENPKTKEDHLERAWAYENLTNKERAIEEYTKAIELDPNYGEAYFRRARARSNGDSEDRTKAISDLIKSLRCGVGSVGFVSSMLAGLLEKEVKPDSAIDTWTELLKLRPEEFEFFYQRSKAHFDKGDWDEVIADCDHMISLNDKSRKGAAYNIRGNMHLHKGDPDKAIADYTNLISLAPDNFGAYFRRGNAFLIKQEWEKASADYTAAIGLIKKRPRMKKDALIHSHLQRALAQYELRNFHGVIDNLTEAINIGISANWTVAENYSSRGLMYARLLDYRLAAEDFTEAIRLDPYNSSFYISRADAYEKMDKPELAKSDRETAKLYSESYTGEYMDGLKERLLKTQPDLENVARDEFMKRTNRTLASRVVLDIKKTLDNLGIDYDQWFYESDLMGEDGAWDRMFNELDKKGYIEERDGAQWFLATKFGAEKDVVVVRSDVRKEHTYFATDFAYHLNKLGPKPPYRDFSRTINIWGGDHHGHVIRLAAAMQAVGIDPARVQVQTVQIVHFKADDKKLKLSKRKGQIVTIDDLLDEVGKDACRYEFLNRSHNAQMTFDIEQAKRQSIENPVYYIQYAHARLCSVLERGAVLSGWDRSAEFDLNLLKHPNERALMFHLTELPMILRTSAERLEPHLVTFYLYELARRFQTFYEECRVISDDKALSNARLLLAYSTKTVLNEVLRLLGISAPERMNRSEVN